MLRSNISTGIDIKSPLPDTSISLARLPPGGVPDRVGGASCPPKIQLRQDPKNTPLDSLTISGTNWVHAAFTNARRKQRFPGNYWHLAQFRAWAEQAENTLICRRCAGVPDENGEQDIISFSMPTNYAFSQFAGKKNQALVYSFAEAISGHSGISGASLVWFVTLTVPHGIQGDYVDMVRTVEALRAGWSGVRRYLNRWGCRFLRVIEPGGKRGYPHYHLVVVGLTARTAEQLRDRWLAVVPGAVAAAQKIEVVKDIENLGAYLTKTLGYVAKQWDDRRDNEHWWHYQELRYRMRIRDIAMDAKSRKYISEKYQDPASGLCCCGETKINWDWGDE